MPIRKIVVRSGANITITIMGPTMSDNKKIGPGRIPGHES